ncbi:hypothetical protein GEMRC1_012561 [Eukaryota sp. GEM-RC1]
MTALLYGVSLSDSESDTPWKPHLSDVSEDESVSDFCISSEDDLEEVKISASSRLFLKLYTNNSNVFVSHQPQCSSKDKSSLWLFVVLTLIVSLAGIYLAVHVRYNEPTPSSQIVVSYPTTLNANLVLQAPDGLEFVDLLWSCDQPDLLEEYHLTSIKNAILVLDPHILLFNGNVTFDLQAFHVNGTLSTFSSTLYLSKPSLLANLIVTPLNDTFFSASFYFSHVSPITKVRYDWCIVRRHECLPLGRPSSKSNLVTLLPPGYPEDKGMVTIMRRTLKSKKVVNEESVSVRVEVGSYDDVTQIVKTSATDILYFYDSIDLFVYTLSETLRHHLSNFTVDSLYEMRDHLLGLLTPQSKEQLFIESIRSVVSTLNDSTQESPNYNLKFVKGVDLRKSDTLCFIANCYYNGTGIKQDKEKAVFWFQKAADLGNSNAMYSLGNCYFDGEGIKENNNKAVRWYKKAAYLGPL